MVNFFRVIALLCATIACLCTLFYFAGPSLPPVPQELQARVYAAGGRVRASGRDEFNIHFCYDRGGEPWDSQKFHELLSYLEASGTQFGITTELGFVPEDWQKLSICEGLTFLHIWCVRHPSGSFQPLANCKGLRTIILECTNATEADVNVLARLSTLEVAFLAKTGATDGAVKGLSQLSNLRELAIGETQVTCTSMPELAKLQNLEYLDLSKLPITDEGLVHLSKLSKLRLLSLVDTHVTLDGLEQFLKASRNCEVYVDRSLLTGIDGVRLKQQYSQRLIAEP